MVSQRKMFGGTCGPSSFDVFACCTSSSGSDMFSESKELVFKTELVPLQITRTKQDQKTRSCLACCDH